MKRLLRDAAGKVSHFSGLFAIARRLLASSGRFALEFHGIAPREFLELPPAARPCLTREDLEKIMVWLDGRFRFLTPEEFLRGTGAGVLLTFDDGLASNSEVALPILERFSAPAIFFVATGHVADSGRRLGCYDEVLRRCGTDPETLSDEVVQGALAGMNPSMVRKCSDHPLVTIGCHTENHPRLTTLSGVELDRELQQSREFLAELTGDPVDLFAYPFGDYDPDVMEAVRRAGYRAAFAEGSKNLGGGWLEIPRIGLYSSDTWYLDAKTSGLFGRPVPGRLGT